MNDRRLSESYNALPDELKARIAEYVDIYKTQEDLNSRLRDMNDVVITQVASVSAKRAARLIYKLERLGQPVGPEIKRLYARRRLIPIALPRRAGRALIYVLAAVGLCMGVMVAAAEPVRVAVLNVIAGQGGALHSVSEQTDLTGLLVPAALDGREKTASRSGQNCYIVYLTDDGREIIYSVNSGNAISDLDTDYTVIEYTTLFNREAVLFSDKMGGSGCICIPSANYICTLLGDEHEELISIAKTISIKR